MSINPLDGRPDSDLNPPEDNNAAERFFCPECGEDVDTEKEPVDCVDHLPINELSEIGDVNFAPGTVPPRALEQYDRLQRAFNRVFEAWKELKK